MTGESNIGRRLADALRDTMDRLDREEEKPTADELRQALAVLGDVKALIATGNGVAISATQRDSLVQTSNTLRRLLDHREGKKP
ncbi:hypothetical protein M3D75_02010 [Microbacterium enclense]|uniref:hypothetical protein n=1 Tax=Microbacterium enclense TaxID=993073 RepID=UPI0021A942F5|nr:hypothetical protein [Microbacterium enclense]MCT2084885.1 hypothetical protein [Microbacterium enclense]